MSVAHELTNRATRSKIVVLNNTTGDEEPLKDDKSNRWGVRCLTHDVTIIGSKNRAAAFAIASKPMDWCKECKKVMTERSS